jgi:carbon monoxide dehydrogenase subunit G
MSRISREIHIKAPVERVFGLLFDPKNLPELWPNLTEVNKVKESDLGGFDYGWVYQMADLKLEGKTKIIEYQTNRKMATKIAKGLQGTMTWDLHDDGEETDLLFEMQYEIPHSLLNGHSEENLVKAAEHDVEAMLQNLSRKAETEMVHA